MKIHPNVFELFCSLTGSENSTLPKVAETNITIQRRTKRYDSNAPA